jgi:hypothetical protein
MLFLAKIREIWNFLWIIRDTKTLKVVDPMVAVFLLFSQCLRVAEVSLIGYVRPWGTRLKGHLISKWFFEVVDFLKKPNENTSYTSKNEFIRSFFGGN